MELKTKEINNGVELKISEPFQPFETDCINCKHFYTIPIHYPSGQCTLHNLGCGMGFTCKNFKGDD